MKAEALGRHFSPEEIEKRSQASTASIEKHRRGGRRRGKNDDNIEIKTLQTASEQQEQRELQEERKKKEELLKEGQAHINKIQKESQRTAAAFQKELNKENKPRKRKKPAAEKKNSSNRKQRKKNSNTCANSRNIDIDNFGVAMGSREHQIRESLVIQQEFKESQHEEFTEADAQRACEELKKSLNELARRHELKELKNVSLVGLGRVSLFHQLSEYVIKSDYPWSPDQYNENKEDYYQFYPSHDRPLEPLFKNKWKESKHGSDNTLTHYCDTALSFDMHATNLWRKMDVWERLVALLMYVVDKDPHAIVALTKVLEDEEEKYIRSDVN